MSRLVIVDTSIFYTDAMLERPPAESLLDGAERGRYELVFPEVVVAEATKHYAQRLRKALRELNLAIGVHGQELAELGEPAPEQHAIPTATKAKSDYETRLRARLQRTGVKVVPHPDFSAAIGWYVGRRKPFKETGQGLADAVVWATALEYARRGDEVILLTKNVNDFGDGGSPPGLAEEMLSDLRSWGLPEDSVRLMGDIAALVKTTADPMAAASRIIESAELTREVADNLLDHILYKPVGLLDEGLLPFSLDDAPQLVSADVRSFILNGVPALYGEALLLPVDLIGTFLLHMLVFKADYMGADEVPGIAVTNWDWNRHYVAVEATVSGRLEVNFLVESDWSVDDVEIHDLTLEKVGP